MSFIAALPMYEWPENRADTESEWRRFREILRRAGIDAPDTIVRRNADMPAVPGGIRDASGKVIARDPAALPPDELHFPTLWRHPDMLICQTCWGPLELGLGEHVKVVGQPSYDGFEGGEGPLYSSAIVMRAAPNPPWMEAARQRAASAPTVIARELAARRRGVDKPAPENGLADIPLTLLGGRRFAFNSAESMSGFLAPSRDLEAMGESLGIFSERIETGSHRGSIVAVAEGRADVCAIDCRSWQLAQLHEPKAELVQVVGWTGRRKGLPMITSLRTPDAVVERLIEVLSLP